ncbi:unknown similar to XecnGV orf106 [Mythimna separata entomopoxvirus 'L']|uniref:Uncharacterized protein n=1 Tax=Mythimna separata entomopoxvirus 'L' TaxID=1293572 RepID=A0A916NYG7_9POXV|nr:unknown similar to XecnGV orf106 [Mythimna separata entomopoxvirus 'L']CCU56363.1 unknown similar to XecnGV orf106 [Mythimna separata entomopoxvirus 'L']
MRIKILFILSIISLLSYEFMCERCGYTKIGFRTGYTYAIVNKEHERLSNAGKHCIDFGGDYNTVDTSYGRFDYENDCKIEVCGDGRVHEGHYCGVGPCNVFGYNCDGGCISGNPVEEFKILHAGKVFDVRVL